MIAKASAACSCIIKRVFHKLRLRIKLSQRATYGPIKVPYARHYNPLLIWNCSWILTIHKVRILQKKLLKKTFLAFKNGVKSIQTAGYNGVRTVFPALTWGFCLVNLKVTRTKPQPHLSAGITLTRMLHFYKKKLHYVMPVLKIYFIF